MPDLRLVQYFKDNRTKYLYCEVKSKFTQNPNANWLNKEMTCLYDPATPLEDAIQDMSRCTGELADAILS